MKEELERNFKELLQMGKGAVSYGEEKLKEFTSSDDFKKFDEDLKKEVSKMEAKGKELKDEFLARGQKMENQQANNNANNVNNGVNNNNNNNVNND